MTRILAFLYRFLGRSVAAVLLLAVIIPALYAVLVLRPKVWIGGRDSWIRQYSTPTRRRSDAVR